MSAYMVGKPHIDAMVHVALFGPKTGLAVNSNNVWSPMRASYVMGERTDLTPDQWGHMLWLENWKSVSYRYDDLTPETGVPGPIDFTPADIEGYTFTKIAGRVPTTVETMVILDCYEYQSCEHPRWETSPAFRFCHALRKMLCSKLPQYRESVGWEWDHHLGA